MNMGSIIELEDKVNKLDRGEKELFGRIFDISGSEGSLKIPDTFRGKVKEYFGDRDEQGRIVESEDELIKKLETQKVMRVSNKYSGEGALFNWLRSGRPGMKPEKIEQERKRVYAHIEEARRDCDFCQPERYTPEDVFGRVRGKYSITAANVAKYDALNGLVIFKNHNPLEFGREELFDYIETSLNWFEKVSQYNNEFRYPFLMWNCLEKAAASQVHGHMQVLMSETYYDRVSALRNVSRQYKEEYGRDYLDDLYRAHNAVELAHSYEDAKILAYLTPIREKELMIIGDSMSNNFKEAMFKTLRCYIDRFGVTSFNLAMSIPVDDEFPYIVRMVDRGSIFKPTADVGAMELFGTSVIATDPYAVIKGVKEYYSR
jgi:hypothetical protein